MMKLLLVAATKMEVKLLLNECIFIDAIHDNHKTYRFKKTEFDLLTTGIGTTFTTFHLTQALQQSDYRLVINAGIAGSLSDNPKVGDVVNVTEEEFADLGIEEEDQFLTLFDSGYLHQDEFPFENRLLKATYLPGSCGLPRVKAITSNISHARKSTITGLKNQFSGKIASMEGAAVFYVCRWLGIPCMQIRAVSNYVAPGNEAHWDIPLALENLKNTLAGLLNETLAIPQGNFS